MSAVATAGRPAAAALERPAEVGPLGRLGGWTAQHVRLVAMLVRLVLIPTLLRVFGRWGWARPRWLDRLLPDVRFGHT